ncbi:MAG: UDP-4-amino-4,6-dideoxy-N-acetyl-beta-L-altrosamine N-acetyltransferase [Bacteroidota bacterium]
MTDIKLIPLSAEDLETVRNWRNSPEVAAYMYTDNFITEEQQKNWFAGIQKNPSVKCWVIEYEGKKLGLASITDINTALGSCSWAFYLGDTSIRGAGIGGKVEYNVMRYVFEELNLNKLRCEVFVFNDSVIKMHEKFGFRREAYYREHCTKNGKYQDVVGLAMLKSEWSVLKENIYNRIYNKN